MSLWKIAWRSIQQRALASSLTALSMALGVALIVCVLVIYGVLRDSFSRGAEGYHLVVGKKGSQLQLVLNSVFHLQDSLEPLPYSFYKQFLNVDGAQGKYARYVDVAIPYCLGDNYQGYRVVATTPELFEKFQYYGGQNYTFRAGRNFDREHFFEAVVGATVARNTGLTVGSTFQPTHSVPGEEAHDHDPFTVVGVLDPTGTPNDRAIFINMEGFYLTSDHAKPLDEAEAIEAEIREYGGDLPARDDHNHDAHDHEDHAHHDEHDHEHDHKHEHEAHADKHMHDDHDHEHEHEHEEAAGVGAEAKAASKENSSAADEHPHDHDDEHAHDHDEEHAHDHDDKHAHDHDHEHAHDDKQDHDHDDHGHAHGHSHGGHSHGHGNGHDHGHSHSHEPLPEAQREVTAILIRARSDLDAQTLARHINEGIVAQAASPIRVINQFFDTMVWQIQALVLVLTVLIVIVAGIGVMVSIYNSMSERRHEIAVMRSLGARRNMIMAIVLLESILLALGGGLLGLVLGHGLIGLLRPLVVTYTGITLSPLSVSVAELYLLPGLVVLATLAGFLPAISAYNTDVAKSLSSTP